MKFCNPDGQTPLDFKTNNNSLQLAAPASLFHAPPCPLVTSHLGSSFLPNEGYGRFEAEQFYQPIQFCVFNSFISFVFSLTLSVQASGVSADIKLSKPCGSHIPHGVDHRFHHRSFLNAQISSFASAENTGEVYELNTECIQKTFHVIKYSNLWIFLRNQQNIIIHPHLQLFLMCPDWQSLNFHGCVAMSKAPKIHMEKLLVNKARRI